MVSTTTTTTVLRPFVRDYPGEPVPDETLTHPPSWSSSSLYQILPSTTIHSILLVQITCLAIFLHNLSPCPHQKGGLSQLHIWLEREKTAMTPASAACSISGHVAQRRQQCHRRQCSLLHDLNNADASAHHLWQPSTHHNVNIPQSQWQLHTRAQQLLRWATVWPQYTVRKVGRLLYPFPWGGSWVPNPHLTQCHLGLDLRYSVPSGILIHPTVWPKYTNVTDRQDRTTVP